VAPHRALIFCQQKELIGAIEELLFRAEMPSVSHVRLDGWNGGRGLNVSGSVAASRRIDVQTRFNNDPTIDVMLLTTQVGGLGLNLTGVGGGVGGVDNVGGHCDIHGA
jgi:TATA-binding protein-associated factor